MISHLKFKKSPEKEANQVLTMSSGSDQSELVFKSRQENPKSGESSGFQGILCLWKDALCSKHYKWERGDDSEQLQME